MDIDLFKMNLDNITYHDIEIFTGILRPEHERRQEGIQIDYKTAISPKDSNHIGETVTAFANTYGGIIMLGVKADKDKQNIPVDIPGIESYKDIKSSITNMIVSAVYPRPSFSIGVAEQPDKSSCVVVVRVEESWITPHIIVTKGSNQNEIKVRINDNNFRASLQQIEGLFERRKSREHQMSERIPYQFFNDLYIIDTSNTSRVDQHHRIHFKPYDNLNIRLDRKYERFFEKKIKTSFNLANLNISTRRADYYEIGICDYTLGKYIQKKWRLYSDVSMGFISEFGSGNPRTEKIGTLLYDALHAFKSYKEILEGVGYFGQSYLQHELSSAKETKLLPVTPCENDDDKINGVVLDKETISTADDHPFQHQTSRALDFSDIERPEETIAEIFLEHLRTLFNGNVSYEKLLEHVRYLNP